jgi:hypothetical protein
MGTVEHIPDSTEEFIDAPAAIAAIPARHC